MVAVSFYYISMGSRVITKKTWAKDLPLWLWIVRESQQLTGTQIWLLNAERTVMGLSNVFYAPILLWAPELWHKRIDFTKNRIRYFHQTTNTKIKKCYWKEAKNIKQINATKWKLERKIRKKRKAENLPRVTINHAFITKPGVRVFLPLYWLWASCYLVTFLCISIIVMFP